MKKTLLQLVQDILNDLDSDAVNSILDTAESEQVANIVRTTYEAMIANRDWPHLRKLFQMDHVGDLTKPNYLRAPEGLKQLTFFKYECQRNDGRLVQREIQFMYPDDFLRFISGRNEDEDWVDVVTDFGGSKLLIVNNQPPTYWTTFDDKYIVVDSYDKNADDVLQKSKTQCLGYIYPTWTHADTFIPDLPTEAFPALFNEALSAASLRLKQLPDQKAEQASQRQQRWLARKAWKLEGGVRYDNYGRKGRK